MMSSRRGQGAAEYLVLLAVVLIVAMVGITLLGGFAGFGGDARLQEARQYWSSTRPFAITEFSQNQNTIFLTILNKEPSRLVLTNITVQNVSVSYPDGITFNGGSSRTFNLTGMRTCNMTSFDTFEYNINFTYSSSDIVNQKQIGVKPISGKCVE